MDEPILDHVARLERAVRRWRNATLILAAILLSLLVAGSGFFVFVHQRNVRTMEAMVHQEAAARADAEAARQHAERALKEARERGK